MALSRKHRLTGSDAFAEIFHHGQRLNGPYLQLLWQRAAGESRFGVAVSKKALKLAVDRNAVKRVLRHACRRRSAEMVNVAVVLRLRRSCRRESFAALAQEADALLLQVPGAARC